MFKFLKKHISLISLKSLSIKKKITITFGILIITVLILSNSLLLILMNQKLINAEEQAMSTQAKQTIDILDLFFATQLKKTDAILTDPEITDLLLYNNTTIDKSIETRKQIFQKLERASFDYKYDEIKGSNYFGGNSVMALYVKNQTLFPSEYESENLFPYNLAEKKEWFEDLKNDVKTFCWESGIIINGINYIACYRKIIDTDTLEDIAILRICIPTAKIQDFLVKNRIVNAKVIFYYDERNNLIFSYGDKEMTDFLKGNMNSIGSSEDNVAKLKVNDEKVLSYTSNSYLNDWKLTCIIPLSVIYQKTRFASILIILSMVVSSVLCLVFSSKISSAITSRIEVLLGKTMQLSNGNFDVTYSVGGNDEITDLDNCFNEMVDKIKSFGQKELDYRMMMEEIKFELYQEQINPHLLYNTLSIIKYSAKKSAHMEIASLSSNLISFYKRFLNTGHFISSIGSEIEMVRYYVQVALSVYNIDAKITYDIDVGVEEFYSIKLFLQPVVENAIIHGIRPKESGNIVIRGKRTDDVLKFIVTDNGKGMDEEKLAGIKDALLNEVSNKQVCCFGMYNVSKRINLFFGNSYGIEIDSELEGGTTVEITIPAYTKQQITDSYDKFRIDNTFFDF